MYICMFFILSPFGKMTFIYLCIVSVKIAPVFFTLFFSLLPLLALASFFKSLFNDEAYLLFNLGDIEHFFVKRPAVGLVVVVAFYTFLIVSTYHTHTHN